MLTSTPPTPSPLPTLKMSRAGQPSILSFFHKQQPPKYGAPPPQQQQQHQPHPQHHNTTGPPPPPPPPPSQAPPTPQPPPTALPTTIPSPHPSASIVAVTEAHIPALRRINALLLPVNYSDSFYKAILDPAVSGLFSRAILWRDVPELPPASSSTSPPPAKVVGGLICRLEPSPFDAATGRYSADLAKKAGTGTGTAAAASSSSSSAVAPPRAAGQGHALYIQSLVLLAPYRGLGLVTAALEGIFDAVAQVRRDRRGHGLRIDWVYAHVWTDNEEGLAWYGRRGFERDAVLERYYWKLRPDSAWVLKRKVCIVEAGKDEEEDDGAGVVVAAARTTRENGGEVRHELPVAAAAVPVSVTAAAVNLPGFAASTTAGPSPPAANGPPPSTSSRPPPVASSLSFQNKRPDMEWNDLPEDMVVNSKNSSRSDLLSPPSGSSSRSSSTGRKKRDRSYPTAAFGS